ncbi:hypothetical protein [Gordonia sp. VNK21]|uniref:hypothetical protein n=1 Tax=Gordonia sp. VNK21 TaxID=3382483 RepID=UPI0038D44331
MSGFTRSGFTRSGFTRLTAVLRDRATRRALAGGLALTATLALAGCGTVDGEAVKADGAVPASSDPSGSASTPATRTADVQELVLDRSEFPAGYAALEVPPSQVQEVLDTVLASTRSATVVPSSCLQVSLIPDSIDTSQVGMATASKGTSVLGTAVVEGGASIADQRKAVTGKCANLTMTMDVSGQQVKSRVAQKVLTAPKTKTADTLVVEQTQRMNVGGQDVTSSTRLGYAQVNGYTVSVAGTSPTGGPIDDEAFDALFVAAVNKLVERT